MVRQPVAVPPLSVTRTVTSVDDGLLRTNTGCTGPSFSLTLYADSLKDMVATVRLIYNINIVHHNYMIVEKEFCMYIRIHTVQ